MSGGGEGSSVVSMALCSPGLLHPYLPSIRSNNLRPHSEFCSYFSMGFPGGVRSIYFLLRHVLQYLMSLSVQYLFPHVGQVTLCKFAFQLFFRGCLSGGSDAKGSPPQLHPVSCVPSSSIFDLPLLCILFPSGRLLSVVFMHRLVVSTLLVQGQYTLWGIRSLL